MLRKRGIDLKQVVSVTTGGAPAMVGRERGAVPWIAEDNPDPIRLFFVLLFQKILLK